MAKRWRIHPHDPDRIETLRRGAGIPAVVAQLLICRGIADPQVARQFLDPKLLDLHGPEELPGCVQAAELIHQAVVAGQRILIYGDYDVDGLTGTAILWLCLRMLGSEVSYYVPHRIDEGYGLSCEALRSRVSPQIGLIVTVDCGIASVEAAATARELGLKLVITDHHEPGPRLPEAAAVVHPRLSGSKYPFGGLSGSGVALKLAWALCQRASGAKKVGQRMKDFLMQAVGLAALGTVADVVPLVGENRVLVRYGLDSLARQPTPGVAALMRTAKLDEKLRVRRPDNRPNLDSEDLAFALAPRLNAAGRLGQPQLAVELLVSDRQERVRELAAYLDALNNTRQTLERSIYLAASKQVKEQCRPADEAALVLADRNWHAGVIGIVAGRLAEKHHRPVVLISWDQLGVKPGIGSARSVQGFNLHEALRACDQYLLSHGGHAAAAGLTIAEDQFPGFRAAFCEVAAAEIGAEQRVAELQVDAEFPLSAFTAETVQLIERLAPFGEGNTRPLLCSSGVHLTEPPRAIGSGGRHLSLMLCQHDVTLRAVAFGGGEWAEELTARDCPLDVAFRPVINTFRGRRNVELHLVDWRKAV
jgi:single-stranded-DNA-specific exonuclease